jgi:hypothetical protein
MTAGAWHVTAAMTAEQSSALATWFGAGIAFVGAGLVIFQLYLARSATREQYASQRRQAAIDFYARTVSQRDQWNQKLPPDRDEAAIGALVSQAMEPAGDATEEARRAIHNYLGFWELLSAGVANGVLDRDTIRSLARGRAVAVWNNYKPFVITERFRYKAGALYRELQNLAESLAAERQAAAAVISLRPQPGSAASGTAIAQVARGGTEITLTVDSLPVTGCGQFYECRYAGPANSTGHRELITAGTFVTDDTRSHIFHMWCAANLATFKLMEITLKQLGDSSQHTVVLSGINTA